MVQAFTCGAVKVRIILGGLGLGEDATDTTESAFDGTGEGMALGVGKRFKYAFCNSSGSSLRRISLC